MPSTISLSELLSDPPADMAAEAAGGVRWRARRSSAATNRSTNRFLTSGLADAGAGLEVIGFRVW